jgi:urease accessory protein
MAASGEKPRWHRRRLDSAREGANEHASQWQRLCHRRRGESPVSAAALLLADARFPAGGHAHSGGVEPAASAGTVSDLASLELFLRGRLRTAGLAAGGLAAAACALALREVTSASDASGAGDARGTGDARGPGDARGTGDLGGAWEELDAEADARTPSPAQREASRRQGRALLRAARAAWPDARWLDDLGRQPHHAVVLGACAAAAGCSALETARIAAYQAVTGPSSAAVRLLALDPMAAAAIVARLAGEVDGVAEAAAAFADGPAASLPFPSAPALDLLAEVHARAEVRLFES